MTQYKLAFLGFGNVGRALAELLLRKQDELHARYNITFSVTGIATATHGKAINPHGIDLRQASTLLAAGKTIDNLSTIPITDSFDFIRNCGAEVLFENTPVSHKDGQPAIRHIQSALQLGMHVATANKGPVVHGYRLLNALAHSQGKKFLHESTVMDGAPIFSLFREAIPAARLRSFKGVLNSTTNLILTRMENGESFEDAVKYAQQIGLAETDPSGDIDGWDAAIKVAALVTVLMGVEFTPQMVDRTGIREISADMIAAAKAEGQRYKLVCSAARNGDQVTGKVSPELVPVSSPMYSIEGSTSIIEFETDVLGELSIVEKNPGPHTTAYGLLADFINAVKER